MTAENLDETGIVIVDHGSRRAESNELLLEVAERFRLDGEYPIVEPAHMELAEPTIATAYNACVSRGARRIVVFPFFLSPGRHWHEDIPRLVASAAASHPQTSYLVAAPLGNHPLMSRIIAGRIADCVGTAENKAGDCEFCEGSERCRWSMIE